MYYTCHGKREESVGFAIVRRVGIIARLSFARACC